MFCNATSGNLSRTGRHQSCQAGQRLLPEVRIPEKITVALWVVDYDVTSSESDVDQKTLVIQNRQFLI